MTKDDQNMQATRESNSKIGQILCKYNDFV